MTEERARDALRAQRFTAPGPKLVGLVVDAIARKEEQLPAGVRYHSFDYAELFADTPELVDRTEGRLTDPATDVSYVIANVITEAIKYVFDEKD